MDMLRVVHALQRIYPISAINIESNQFDPALMNNPDIKGAEYQRGTLYGTNLRAYIFERDHNRCVYCGKFRTRLELDHVRPRAIGSNRVDNLVVSCRDCNVAKDNQTIEQFLADDPARLARILSRISKPQASAAHVNAALPAIIRDLWILRLPLSSTDATTVAWNRQRLDVRKTHCYDDALQGTNFTTVVSLPSQVIQLKPANGRSKQKANIGRHGTPVGQPFRRQQHLPRHHNPAAGHSDQQQRHGTEFISTGDTVQMSHKNETITGRGIINNRGKRVAIHGTKPMVSAQTSQCRLLARNPRWVIRRTTPSQQSHASTAIQDQNEHQTANT